MDYSIKAEKVMVTFPNGETDSLAGFISGMTDISEFKEGEGWEFYDHENESELTIKDINEYLKEKNLI